MADKRILCAFGIDVDAVAGKLGSYQGEDSPFDISRVCLPGRLERRVCSNSLTNSG